MSRYVRTELARRKSPLEPQQLQDVENAALGPDTDTVCESHDQQLQRSSYKRLMGLSWLNDEVVNYFLSKLTERTYSYNNVKRWSTKAKLDVFEADKILFPHNIGNMHWCLAIVHVQEKRIEYMDSMSGDGLGAMSALFRYFKDEHADKKGSPLKGMWTRYSYRDTSPQQKNGCDCGVFTLPNADYVLGELPLDFHQDDIPHFQAATRILAA
ncbi:hypothetical protein JKP88DRAFT_259592 [Tribonema minus]|uniref:Ubiquitin-like protease family profile domain-containing protein n=1 Tax=Tribonema minus TaxID=303371 RepID=A0A835ZFD9_9STRA|nr:hypothetical protein JKP88DRAFT_259592 [Tribonema minus]